jgi:flagellar biosynthesis protein FlhF
MNIQRFTAATSREALSKARMAFGDSTLILSNRPTENGVEVVATAEETLAALDTSAKRPSLAKLSVPNTSGAVGTSAVEDDANLLAMSTLSFQDYVRERMLRKRHESSSSAATDNSQPVVPVASTKSGLIRIKPDTAPARAQAASNPPATKPPATKSPAPEALVSPKLIVNELQAMKAMMEERFNTLAWLGQARQNPIQSNLMLRLIRAGYTPALSRAILEKLPAELNPAGAMRWLLDVLKRNLKTQARGLTLPQEGGVFALLGTTGVGKTTTAAKLASLCVEAFGPSSVGLITLDTQRIGAHEQLRVHGKMLGVVAHLAHDRSALQDLLNLLSSKRMVVIDTAGMAPHDPRKQEVMELIDLPAVQRVLVLNAGAQGETLDETVNALKTSVCQSLILSKTDEAAKLGPAIDVAIRHQLVLRGVTNGQRVPEDWEAANPEHLIRQSLRTSSNAMYETKANDLSFYFSEPLSSNDPLDALCD